MKLYVGNEREKIFLAKVDDVFEAWKEIDKYLGFETHYHSYRELSDESIEIDCGCVSNFFYYQKD